MRLLRPEPDRFRLVFRYDRDLVAKVRDLPHACYDPPTRSWVFPVCAESVAGLRGLADFPVLRKRDPVFDRSFGSVALVGGPPWRLSTVEPESELVRKFLAAAGRRRNQMWVIPDTQTAVVAELVHSGEVADPFRLLSGDGKVRVCYDAVSAGFKVFVDCGRREQAETMFRSAFPGCDVVKRWVEMGHDTCFADGFSEKVYSSMLSTEGVQPPDFGVDLYPYQREAVAKALQLDGLLIADEAGLGKTAQAVAVGAECLRTGSASRVVAVVSGSLRTQWADEIRKFTGEEATVVHGTKKVRAGLYRSVDRWVVVHYDVLWPDRELTSGLCEDAVLLVDEVHRVRNQRTNRTKAVRALAREAEKTVALSATTVENNPGEWFSTLDGLCNPGVFGSFDSYAGLYMTQNTFGGWAGARNLGLLRTRSAPFFVRRRKKDVASFLPRLRVDRVPVDYDRKYGKILGRLHREAKKELMGVVASPEAAPLTACTMLRMLCSTPKLLLRSESKSAQALVATGLIPDVDGPKLDVAFRLGRDYAAASQRVLMFVSFELSAVLLSNRFRKEGLGTVIMTGGSTRSERDEAVAAFNAPDSGVDVAVFTDVAAEGLNLDKQCSTLVNVDIPWTPGRLEQRANRIHRLSSPTDRRYRVVNLCLRNTMEDRMMYFLDSKADMMDDIYGESDGRERIGGVPAKEALRWFEPPTW